MTNPEFERSYIEIPPTATEFEFRVADYFLVKKLAHEVSKVLADNGLNPNIYDPTLTPPEVQRKLWDEAQVDSEGCFTFYPGRMVLGHTQENIIIPSNRMLRMRGRFMSKDTGEELPLTTNWGAPLLHPGSKGPQTYEIVNEISTPMEIRITDLVCIADVFQLTGDSPQNKQSRFGEQKIGEIKLGNQHDSWEGKAIRNSIQQTNT